MYIKVEGKFIRSEAVRNLTHPQFRILIALTLRCVELHSHRIAYMNLNQLHSSIAPECGGVNIATFRASLRALQASGFVKLTQEGGLKILELPGVLETHPQIKWSGRPGMAGGGTLPGPAGDRRPQAGGNCRNPKAHSDLQTPDAGLAALAAITYRSTESPDENPLSTDEDSLFEDGFSLSEGETPLAEDEKSLTPLDVTPSCNSTCNFSPETLSSERTESIESMKAEATGDPSPVRRLSSVVCRSEPKAVGHRTQGTGPKRDAERSTEGFAEISPFMTCPEVVRNEPIKEGANLEIGVLPSTRCGLARFGISATDGRRTTDDRLEQGSSFALRLDAALDALLHEDLDHGSICTVLSTLYGRELTAKELLKAMRLADARLFGAMIASGRHRPDKPPIAAFRFYAFGSVMPPDWAMEEVSRLLRSQLMIAD